ncbi:MAG: hypothetical protein HN341_09570 [Verrucomicrobia bacterium]|nr:hypothetical protein [Verrucomicrobiota bacterium]
MGGLTVSGKDGTVVRRLDTKRTGYKPETDAECRTPASDGGHGVMPASAENPSLGDG